MINRLNNYQYINTTIHTINKRLIYQYNQGKIAFESKVKINILSCKNAGADYYTYDRLMEKLNSKIAEDNKTGVNVAFDYDYKNRYSTTVMNPNEIHSSVEQLVESTVLFDKSGNVSRVKKTMEKHGHLYGFYLVDYVPPINETIMHKLIKINKGGNEFFSRSHLFLLKSNSSMLLSSHISFLE